MHLPLRLSVDIFMLALGAALSYWIGAKNGQVIHQALAIGAVVFVRLWERRKQQSAEQKEERREKRRQRRLRRDGRERQEAERRANEEKQRAGEERERVKEDYEHHEGSGAAQKLFAYDKVVLVHETTLTESDIRLLQVCRHFKQHYIVVRTKSDMHIFNYTVERRPPRRTPEQAREDFLSDVRQDVARFREQHRTTANDFRDQWTNPSDIFSLLLLVGGDVIQKALAQFTLNRFRPMAFSFGWVAYAFGHLLFAVGNLKALPDPDCPCTITRASSMPTTSANQSWLLGRLVRNHEYWSVPLIKDALKSGRISEQDASVYELMEPPTRGLPKGLQVFIYKFIQPSSNNRSLSKDWPWFSGLITTLIQLGVAAIPAGLYGEWEILLITAGGTALAYATAHFSGYSPFLRSRGLRGRAVFTLTEGNGSRTAIVFIKDTGIGVDLERLTRVELTEGSQILRIAAASVQLVFWVALLITVSGLKTHTWFMVAVGALGMMQNLILAGAPRTPEALGMPVQLEQVVGLPKVMDTLLELEAKVPYAGKALLPIYSPGRLREREVEKWEALESGHGRVGNVP
ncbi:hypothetical protein THAR02_01455 [Trichoderma harzianum]|uniref:Uncharacterized protein n=1 Tax=Trichoderma harzianum TaxID=5544 RepID=A0A0G0APF2_TRIHA|nr:hypothetical protein THAR02_01455 [Trichoderma harzianum]